MASTAVGRPAIGHWPTDHWPYVDPGRDYAPVNYMIYTHKYMHWAWFMKLITTGVSPATYGDGVKILLHNP